jgi:hypothetical protein
MRKVGGPSLDTCRTMRKPGAVKETETALWAHGCTGLIRSLFTMKSCLAVLWVISGLCPISDQLSLCLSSADCGPGHECLMPGETHPLSSPVFDVHSDHWPALALEHLMLRH